MKRKKSAADRGERLFKAYQDRILAEDVRYLAASEPVDADVWSSVMRVHLTRTLHAFYARRSLLKRAPGERFSKYLRDLARAFRRTEAMDDRRRRSKD